MGWSAGDGEGMEWEVEGVDKGKEGAEEAEVLSKHHYHEGSSMPWHLPTPSHLYLRYPSELQKKPGQRIPATSFRY